MVGTSRQRDKSVNEFTYDDSEGTAARTRPFSMEDIRLRKENKRLITAQDSVSKKSLDNKAVESARGISTSGTDYRHKKDCVNENVKKINLVESMIKARNIDKELVQNSSSKIKKMEAYDADVSSKSISHGDKSRDRVRTDEKRRSHQRGDEGHDAGSKIGIEKKQYKDMKLKDKRDDGGRNSEREDKRESNWRHQTGVTERKMEPDENDTRKYDSHHRQINSYLDQKSRIRVSSVVTRDSYHDREEPRSKRRRSASREHHRMRDRPVLASPKERKRTSYREREHESSSYHSFKEKRDWVYSEVDKSRKNNSLSGGHHWRYGESGIGGYSPRKRKSEAAVKTPSPTIRSPERRTAAWDILPANAEDGASVPKLASFLSSQQVSPLSELPAASPEKSTALNQHPPANTSAVPSVDNSAPEDDIQLTQATRPSRRLYVENVPVSASDRTLLDCFSNFLLSSGTNRVQGRAPALAINKEKNQALLEFLTPEDATAALSFDGKLFFGSVLRIKRPKDFTEATTGIPDKFGAKIDAVSDLVKDSPNKIFIGGISKALSSNMLREIVSVFGQLKAYHFEWKDSNLSYAFLEYMDQSITQRACAGLNGMTLGGHVITVVQATPDALEEDINSEHSCYSIPDHAKPLLMDPTPVLKLKNVFSEEEFGLLTEAELEEILEDVRLECQRFGMVKSVNVVRYSRNYVIAVDASVTSDNGGSLRCLPEPAGNSGTVTPMPMDDCLKGDDKTIVQKSDDGAGEQQDNLKGDDEAIVEKSDRGAGEHQNNHECVAGSTEDSQDKDPADLVASEPNRSYANLENEECTVSKIDVHVNLEQLLDNGDSNLMSFNKEADIDTSVYMKEEPTEERGVFVRASNELQNELLKVNKPGPEDSLGMQRTSVKMIGLESDDLQKVPTETEQAVQEKLEGKRERAQDDLGNCESNTYDPLIFEPGNIFVEFMRKEGACLAAHSLHGRLYGSRAVATEYIPLDLYKARFLR